MSRKPKPIPEVMTVEEVAMFLGLNRNTVYEAANRGEIPNQRVGRRILFLRTAVVEWLARGHANNP